MCGVCSPAGDTMASITVRQFPPSDSCGERKTGNTRTRASVSHALVSDETTHALGLETRLHILLVWERDYNYPRSGNKTIHALGPGNETTHALGLGMRLHMPPVWERDYTCPGSGNETTHTLGLGTRLHMLRPQPHVPVVFWSAWSLGKECADSSSLGRPGHL